MRPDLSLSDRGGRFLPLSHRTHGQSPDETVHVYILLSAACSGKEHLRSYLTRLDLMLEVHIANAHVPDRDGPPPANDVIYQASSLDLLDPVTWMDEKNAGGSSDRDGDGEDEEERGSPRLVHAVWKLSVHINRPRVRHQSPSAVFCVTAQLKPAPDAVAARHDYLASGVAAGMNLLESFANEPALGGITPRLSALRVCRVAPLTSDRDRARPIKTQPNVSVRIYPAIQYRVRFTRPNTAPPSRTIIVMLELDFTPFLDCEILIKRVGLTVPHGHIDDLNDSAMMAPPLRCVAHDHVTFLYRILPADLHYPPEEPVQDLEITIDATALVQPKICQPQLTISWTTKVDFTLPVNPSFGSAVPAIQRSHRPNQLSISAGGEMSSMKSPSVTRPDAIPTLEAAARSEAAEAAKSPEIGVAITLKGPKYPIYVGQVFSWSVFVVNHTPVTPVPGSNVSQAPRKFAMMAIPKRRRNEVRPARPPSISGHAGGGGGGGKGRRTIGGTGDGSDGPGMVALADVVLDDNVVHALQRSSVVDAPEVVCLSADFRIGPLAPGACHTAELKFLALKSGIVGIEALRVVDLGSNEHVDVYDLPITVVRETVDGREGLAG